MDQRIELVRARVEELEKMRDMLDKMLTSLGGMNVEHLELQGRFEEEEERMHALEAELFEEGPDRGQLSFAVLLEMAVNKPRE
ncbi:hypothetical protein L915_09807 [Phytophthora nicotianae]|uniref:Uncharacterized protein n=1 Tax=Phytophthora nicotianae TaxID=4792 RepID=W2IXD0_PHYNI|nr:hypothetical protein L915_09807 [Phytophthora nicotianae]ETL38771.1 hypothetical protein L916_09716 [Phytophthora nicotianae]